MFYFTSLDNIYHGKTTQDQRLTRNSVETRMYGGEKTQKEFSVEEVKKRFVGEAQPIKYRMRWEEIALENEKPSRL